MLLPEGNNSPKIKHLIASEKELRAIGLPAPPELIAYYELECPEDLEQYWQDFLDLSRRRGMSESGPNPITWIDIHSWASVCKIELTQVQIDIFSKLDEVWLATYQKKNKPKTKA